MVKSCSLCRVQLRLLLALVVMFASVPAFSVDRWVTNKSQFSAVMSVVQPGDVIIWKNGTYTDQSSITFEPMAQGTAANPITLRAETPGGVVFRGNTKLLIGGHHLVVSGFRFDNSTYSFSGTSTAGSIIDFRAHSDIARHAYNCRVTDCTLVNYDNPAATGSSKWVLMYGGTNQFDHNYVDGKTARGALLVVELNAAPNDIVALHRINNNVFANRPPGPENEYETVRVGTSTFSEQNARVTVESNYFYRCSGEAEIVSNKSAENTYRYNTFVECAGSLTLRHGRGCLVEGNVFMANNVANSGGIRVANQDHVIINNYMQDLAGTAYQAGLSIMDGSTWNGTSTSPDVSGGYVQVKNATIAHNTMVNAADAVNYGVGSGSVPRDSTFAGNIIVSTNAPIFTLTSTPINITYLDNIVWGAATGLAANPELVVTNPMLVADGFGIQRPATNSPAVDAAGTDSLLPGSLLDLDGALRPLMGRDIGADEVGLGTRHPAPMSAQEVGPTWMQTGPPPLLTPPMGQTNTLGSTVFFSVAAWGGAPLSYQWRKDGTSLSDGGSILGATSNILTISNLQFTNAGNYQVIVTNMSGAVTSAVASLGVIGVVAPSITNQPSSQTVLAGSNVLFTVGATGTAPLKYQWYFNTSTALPNAANNSLTVANAQSINAGGYTVVVTNIAGAVTSVVASLTVANAPAVPGTNGIVNDSFADADRANTGPLQADWWSSSSTSGNSIECYTNQLGLITGTSGRGIHGTFTPQTLAMGDTIRATYTFTTPAYVTNAPGLSGAFKVALMNFNNAGLAADLNSSSSSANPLYIGQPGYMADFDINTGPSANITFRKHSLTNTSGRFLGTTGEWDEGTSSADAGYGFLANTEYVGVFSITRTGTDRVELFSSISQGATLMDSHTETDASGIANNFGMLGFWANSGVFGNTTTAGEAANNGITFLNIKVEVVTAAAPPTLNITRSGSYVVLFWPTTGSTGYNLMSTPSLTSPTWVANGLSPVVAGDSYVVTNVATGSQKFYRLSNP